MAYRADRRGRRLGLWALLLAGVLPAVAACGSSNWVDGEHTLTYTVVGKADHGVGMTYGDPGQQHFEHQLHHLLPWSKTFVETGMDTGFVRMTVNNTANDNSLNCALVDDNHVLVSKVVPAHRVTDCVAAHL